MTSLKDQFETWDRLEIHLAPPLMGNEKHRFGPWVLRLMPLLARLKLLRGTWADPFGRTRERRQERALILEFQTVLDQLADGLSPSNLDTAVKIASAPRQIRGFGHIKVKAINEYHAQLADLLNRFAPIRQQSSDCA